VGQQLSFNAVAAVSLLEYVIEYERQQPTAILNGRKTTTEQPSHNLSLSLSIYIYIYTHTKPQKLF
jgi:hypothetical protein